MNQAQTAEQIEPSDLQQSSGEYRVIMTDIEFLKSFNEGKQAEWVDGEAIVFMSPNPRHQRMVAFLNMLLGLYIHVYQLGELIVAPLAMRITPLGSIREPD